MPKMDAAGQLALLKKIIAPAGENELPVDLSRLEKIIKEEIPRALEKNAPANFPELYFDFEYVYSKFYDFLLFQPLIGKTVVALGGGFSSGKSTFLNTLLGNAKILPTAIRPSTSVPAYVIHGEEEKARGINAFSAKVDMEIPDIRAIAHGFGETEDSEGEITLGHLMRSVFVATPKMPYKNIAFLDTPGYSKADSVDYSAKTDEKIAHSQLNASDYILWFVSADAGTISVDDVNFLAGLEKNIPKLVIINKADKAPNPATLREMKENIKTSLDMKGIRYEDVLTYSRNAKTACDREEVEEYLQKLDSGKAEADFARSFKKLFVECKRYYDDTLLGKNRQLSRIQRALTFAGDDDEVKGCLSDLVTRIETDKSGLVTSRDALKNMQNEFFSEIKGISDEVHINMPEPSAIEMMEERADSIFAVVEEMTKSKNINDSDKFWLCMKREFADMPEASNVSSRGTDSNVDFASLKFQGEQMAVKDHPLKNAAMKEAYLTLLLSSLTICEENQAGWSFLYRIAAGAHYDGDIRDLLNMALTMQADTVTDILDGIKQEGLVDIFLLDSILLQLYLCDKDERIGIYFSNLYALLGVSDRLFEEASEATKLILARNIDNLGIIHRLKSVHPISIFCHMQHQYENVVSSIDEAKRLQAENITILGAKITSENMHDLNFFINSNIIFLYCSFDLSLPYKIFIHCWENPRSRARINFKFIHGCFYMKEIRNQVKIHMWGDFIDCIFESVNQPIILHKGEITSCHFRYCAPLIVIDQSIVNNSLFDSCGDQSHNPARTFITVEAIESTIEHCRFFACSYNEHLVVVKKSYIEKCIFEKCKGTSGYSSSTIYLDIYSFPDKGIARAENNTFIDMGNVKKVAESLFF